MKNWQSLGKIALTSRKFYHVVFNPIFLKKTLEMNTHLFSLICKGDLIRKIIFHTHFCPKNLEHLTFDLAKEDLNETAANGYTLTKVRFKHSSFSPQDFIDFLHCFPELEYIEFNDFQMTNFDDYLIVLSLHGPQLKHLKVINCQMNDQSLLAFACQPIRLISFEYESSFQSDDITQGAVDAFLSNAGQLESIKFVGCPLLTQLPLTTFLKSFDPNNPNFRKGSYLKHLSFVSCGDFNHLLFDALSNYCPHLNSLEIGGHSSHPHHSHTESLAIFIENGEQLTTLKLKHFIFNPLILTKIGIFCSKLKHLEIFECTKDRGFSFKEFRKYTNLLSFKFKPIHSTTLLKQDLFDLQKCQQMEELCLINCTLSEENLEEYIQAVPSLISLQLIQCGIFQPDFIHQLKKYANLKVLSI